MVTKATSSKEEIIRAAKKVFATKGFDGATVKDICDLAKINVSAISYHFGGKDELYTECLEQFGRDRLASAERMLRSSDSLDDFRTRLKMFAEEFIECHLREPDITQILHKECTSEHLATRKLFKDVFMKSFDVLHRFFKDAKENKILKKTVDPLLTSSSFFGSIVHFLRTDSLAKEFFGYSLHNDKFRQSVVNMLVDQLLFGIQSES